MSGRQLFCFIIHGFVDDDGENIVSLLRCNCRFHTKSKTCVDFLTEIIAKWNKNDLYGMTFHSCSKGMYNARYNAYALMFFSMLFIYFNKLCYLRKNLSNCLNSIKYSALSWDLFKLVPFSLGKNRSSSQYITLYWLLDCLKLFLF